nr:unnamed protein product [Naegleria fowleri]
MSSSSFSSSSSVEAKPIRLSDILRVNEERYSELVNEMNTRFDLYFMDLNKRANFIKDQITNSSSLCFVTPSFKGFNGLPNSGKKTPFHFNHSGKKKTPLRTPPVGVYHSHLPLHKSSPNMMMVPSPLMRKPTTPLATRNIDQEQNISNNNHRNHSMNNIQQQQGSVHSSPSSFRSFQSPKGSTSGGGRKKKFSAMNSQQRQMIPTSKNELTSPQQSPIPMIIDNTELERDLLSPLPALDLEKDMTPIEPVLDSGAAAGSLDPQRDGDAQGRKSGLSDDLDMIHTVESLSTDSDSEKSEHLIIAGTTSTSPKCLSQSLMSKETIKAHDDASSEHIPVDKVEAATDKPPQTQNPVHHEQSVNHERKPSCASSLPSLNIQVKQEELSDNEEEVVVEKKQKRQVRRKPKTPNHHSDNVVSTNRASNLVIDLTNDSGETNVTEQISHLSLFENCDKMMNDTTEEPTPVSADVLRPEIIFPTFNNSCSSNTQNAVSSMMNPSSMVIVKQEPVSPVGQSQPFIRSTFEKNCSELDGNLTDDSVLCLSVPSDSEMSDLFEDNEKDVCVKINFASPPLAKSNNNNSTENRPTISELVPSSHPPKIPDSTEDLICDAQNLFSKFAFSSTTTSTDLLKSLQEKISSLKSIESPQSSYHTSLDRPEVTEMNRPLVCEMPLSSVGNVTEPSTTEPIPEPATPTAVVGAMEKLGQLSIHNKKVEQFLPSPGEVQLSPPPFESMHQQQQFETPVKEAKSRDLFSLATSHDASAASGAAPELPTSSQMEESMTPLHNSNTERRTPPPSVLREPPTVSQHGKYKMLIPDGPVPISAVVNAMQDVDTTPLTSTTNTSSSLNPPNITATTLAEDAMEIFSKKDSINIIDVDEHDGHDHKRKFQSKISSDSNDLKRVKLSDGNRLSVASITSISSVSSTASSVSASSNHAGSFVSNIFTGVKSFVFKATQKKTSSSSNHASKKHNINSLKQAELAKKREEEKKNLKKEKLEKQLAAQKKKKEQEEEQTKKQRQLSNKNIPSVGSSGKAAHVEGTTLRTSNSSSTATSSSQTSCQSQQQAPQPPKRPAGLILKHTSQPLLQTSNNSANTKKPTPNSVSTSSIPLLQQSQMEQQQQRYSSYALSDEYDSSEDEEEARKRRQTKKIPSWAQGDNLRRNLRRNLRVDPDKIFSVTKTCDLEEIFAGSTNEAVVTRFRQRTSSSNWTEDHFTIEEEQAYREEMGFNC